MNITVSKASATGTVQRGAHSSTQPGCCGQRSMITVWRDCAITLGSVTLASVERAARARAYLRVRLGFRSSAKCLAISAAHGRSSSSLLNVPTHCNPSGRRLSLNPAGMVMQGRPA